MASSSSSPILFEELYHDSSPGNTANRGSRITEAVLQNDLNTTSPTTGSTCTINPHPLADMFLSTPSQLDKQLSTSILPNTMNCEQMVPIVSLGCGVNWPALKPDTLFTPSIPCSIDPHALLCQESSEQSSTSVKIPESKVYPGQCGFKVHFPAAKHDSSTNTLLLRPNECFPASFQFHSSPPPKGCYVRALVCLKEPDDIHKFGPCKRCFKHPAQDSNQESSQHFLLCTNSKACYSLHLSHRIVTVPLSSMCESDVGPTCVYKCVCHSSCIVGRGQNKPILILIMSLIHNGNEIGRDVVNLRSCSNPKRDRKRCKQSDDKTEIQSPPFQKLRRGQYLHDNDPDLDEDGYYNFTWRGKERIVFDLLNLIKEGYTNGPRKQ